MAIIFEDEDGYISYIQPENILMIKSGDTGADTITYATVNTDDKNDLDTIWLTKAAVDDILNQLNQQNYRFVDVNGLFCVNMSNKCYINKDAIESIRTCNNSRLKTPMACVEIKTNLQHYNLDCNYIDLEKTKQFIKSLEVKK